MKNQTSFKNIYIDLKTDLAFKTYFQQNKVVLISMLKSFFPDIKKANIKDLIFLNPEHLVASKDKRSILDLCLLLENGSRVNVEIQLLPEFSFLKRVIFYWSRMYASSLRKGQDYKELKPIYSLIITDFTLFKGIDRYINRFSICCEEVPYFSLSRDLQMVFVELNKFKGEELSDLFDLSDLWCYIIKRSGKMTKEEAKDLKAKGEDMSRAMWHLEKMSESSRRQIVEDLKEKAEGRLQGQLKYQREAGKKEGIKQIALNMLSEGMDVARIAKVTKLSIKEIQQLKSRI